MTEKNHNRRTAELVTADTLDRYVSEINRYKLLSREDEYELAVRFSKDQDLDAAHEMVTANLRFVVKVAHEYKGYGLRLLDLIQEGNIGLMMAVKKFEPKRGFRLISYAVWWIRAYMQNFVLKSWSLVKIGTTQAQRKLFYKLRGTQAQIAKMEGRQHEDSPRADPAAVAKALNVDVSEVVEMDQRLSARDFSLDQEIGDDSKLSFVDRLTDDSALQDETAAKSQSDYRLKDRVANALKTLNEKERYIVEKRLMADEPLTLREIGERFKISRERARQIEANVIKKVKKLLSGAFEEAYA